MSGRKSKNLRRAQDMRRLWDETATPDLLVRLCKLWDEHAEVGTVAIVPTMNGQMVVGLRALVAHAVECGWAVAMLYSAGQPLPAVPVIRTIMEDAVTAMWLLKRPNAWKAFLYEGALTRRTLLRTIKKANPDLSPERMAAELAAVEQVMATYEPFNSESKFEQRAAAVTGTGDLYVQYRLASGLSHVGERVASLYTHADPSSRLGMAWVDEPKHTTADMWMRFATVLVLRALTAWDHVLVDHPLRPELEIVGARFAERGTLTFAPLFKSAEADEARGV